jgi:hypothetical protein
MKPFWLLLFAAVGCAQREIPSFGELDTDGNGRLMPTEAERSPELSEVFEDIDADRDGQLTVGEYLVAARRS